MTHEIKARKLPGKVQSIFRKKLRSSKHISFVRRFALQTLEAQQRYFSYRAILVAIVSQKYFMLVFMGVSHNYRAIRCKMGYRTDVLV